MHDFILADVIFCYVLKLPGSHSLAGETNFCKVVHMLMNCAVSALVVNRRFQSFLHSFTFVLSLKHLS
jgi:hypothetical protein